MDLSRVGGNFASSGAGLIPVLLGGLVPPISELVSGHE